MSFESWFNQVELYGLKSERFYDLVKLQVNNPVYAESLVAWLRAAYEAGQEREWVGLTDEEIKEIIGPWGDTPIKGYTRKLFDQIEAKLKEKNDG